MVSERGEFLGIHKPSEHEVTWDDRMVAFPVNAAMRYANLQDAVFELF